MVTALVLPPLVLVTIKYVLFANRVGWVKSAVPCGPTGLYGWVG